MATELRESRGGKAKKKRSRVHSLEELRTLGNQLLSSRVHINNLPVLVAVFSSAVSASDDGRALECLLSLQSFFTPLVSELPPSSSKSVVARAAPEDSEVFYRTWLRAQLDQFVKSLIEISAASELDEAIKDIALDAVMEFVKLGKNGSFQFAIYHKLLRNVVYSASSTDFIMGLLSSKFFKFVDIRYYTYVSLEKIARIVEPGNVNKDVALHDGSDLASDSREDIFIRRIHSILMSIPPLISESEKPLYEMWSNLGLSGKEAGSNVSANILEASPEKSNNLNIDDFSTVSISKKLRFKFTKAWLSFLRLPLPLEVYKEVIANLHQIVIPHMKNPVILSDFLTRSYDIGGVVSVMALSSLFILMTQHGLEYPNFYDKLYALLVPAVFMARYRAKFFELLDSCLKSPLLPAYLAAAFAKKLSRLALFVPPSGSLVIIAIIHNLLRRHPAINCLVHRESVVPSTRADESGEKTNGGDPSSDGWSRKIGIDPFKSEESDPMKSDAMRSSLWEVDTLRHHYCPAISRFVLSLETDLTVRAKTTEMAVKDFSSGSYATIFKNEIGRRIKQVPLAFYKAIPTTLFSESDFPGWSFEIPQNNEEKDIRENIELEKENGETNADAGDSNKSLKRQRLES